MLLCESDPCRTLTIYTSFTDVSTGILIQHAFVLTLQQVSCSGVGICIDAGGDGTTGSLSVIDSSCEDCGTVVNGSSSFLLENIASASTGSMLKTNGQDILTGDLVGQTYAVGHLYATNNGTVDDTQGTYLDPTDRGNLVGEDGKYFTKSQPQYEDWDVSSFSSVKDHGAKGALAFLLATTITFF